MFKTIMVPTDCSGFDREAIRVALRIAGRSDAKIRLVRVLTSGAYFGVGDTKNGVGTSLNATKRERDQALTELYALAAECRRTADVDVTVSLESGPVTDALEGYAKRNDVDLIVISSHGRGGISRLSLGSVTDTLIRRTTIPVLVVKPTASYLNPEVRGAFKKIVVPLDGSPLAEQIIAPVMTFAVLEEAEVTLLNVIQRDDTKQKQPELATKAPWWEKDVAAAKAYLAKVADRLRVGRIGVLSEVIVGDDIAEDIAAYAGREAADLIAIATHGRGGLARVLRGSVADALTRTARSCILVFHPTATPAAQVTAEGKSFAQQY